MPKFSVTRAFERIVTDDGTAIWRCRVHVGDDVECGEGLKVQRDHSTSALRRHILRKHAERDEFKLNEVLEQTVSRLCGGLKRQRTLSWTKISEASPCCDNLDVENAAVNFVVSKGVPLNVFEGDDAARLLGMTKGPPALTIGRRLEQRLQDAMRSMQSEFSVVRSAVLTSDVWTSAEGASFLAIFAVFIDSDWKLVKRLIGFESLSRERHTGEIIAGHYDRVATSVGFRHPAQQIVALVADNGSNMIKGAELWRKKLSTNGTDRARILRPFGEGGTLVAFACIAHVLHDTMRDGLSLPEIGSIVTVIQGICRKVRKSTSLKRHLDLVMSSDHTSPLRPLNAVPTRWHSVHDMLMRYEKLEKYFLGCFQSYRSEVTDNRIRNSVDESITALRWLQQHEQREVIGHLRQLLCAIRLKTRTLEKDNCSSMASVVLIYLDLIHETLRPEVIDCAPIKNMKLLMADKLSTRIKSSDLNAPVICMLLHPCFIRLPTDSIHRLSEIATASLGISLKAFTKATWQRLRSADLLPPELSTGTSVSSSLPESNAAIADMLHPDPDGSDWIAGRIASEMIRYKECAKQYKGDCPLIFWQTHSAQLPLLAEAARAALIVPATSGMVERAFSVAGWLSRKYRSTLPERRLQTLMILRHNRFGRFDVPGRDHPSEESSSDSNIESDAVLDF